MSRGACPVAVLLLTREVFHGTVLTIVSVLGSVFNSGACFLSREEFSVLNSVLSLRTTVVSYEKFRGKVCHITRKRLRDKV